MATNYPINPRVRAYGKARLDIAGRATNQAEWEKLWKKPQNSFPFSWGDSWKQCVEYRVDDFAAEVGFFTDILGLSINALDPGYAMFTSPQGDFYFSIVPTPPVEQSTPPDAIRLQFMVQDVFATSQELQKRGIEFEQPPLAFQSGSSLFIASFRSPHGIIVELWGREQTSITPAATLKLQKDRDNGEDLDNEDDVEDDEDEYGDEELDVDGEDDGLYTNHDGGGDEAEPEAEDEEGDPSEDGDDEELDGDAGDAEDEDEFDFDADDDEEDDDDEDYDGDSDASPLKSDRQAHFAQSADLGSENVRTTSFHKAPGNPQDQAPEYIDLDIS